MQNARISSFLVGLIAIMGIASHSTATTCEEDQCRRGPNRSDAGASAPDLTAAALADEMAAIAADQESQLDEEETDYKYGGGMNVTSPAVKSYAWRVVEGDGNRGFHSNAGRHPNARSATNWQNGRRTRDTRIDRRADLPPVALASASNGPPLELPLPAQRNGRGIPGPPTDRPAAAVPEPTAALLFGAGVFVIGMATRRPRA